MKKKSEKNSKNDQASKPSVELSDLDSKRDPKGGQRKSGKGQHE